MQPIDEQRVWDQVKRINQDDAFKKSRRCQDFLAFVVRCTLEDETERLKERIIGIEVFGRPADYDTNTDPTVRVVANEVRKRLALYYQGSGREHELRIEIHSGSYHAHFSEHLPETGEIIPILPFAEASPLPVSPSAPTATRSSHLLLLISSLLIVIMALCFAGWKIAHPRGVEEDFWWPVLHNTTSVVVGSPNLPSDNSTQDKKTALTDCCINVSMLDVQVGDSLSHYLHRWGAEASLHGAQDISLSDLHKSPDVFVGINNDWLLRFSHDLPIRFRTPPGTATLCIEDSRIQGSERFYCNIQQGQNQMTQEYALIMRVYDSTLGNWFYGMAGLSGAGTQQTAQMVTQQNNLQQIAARLPGDWKKKNIEILVSIRTVSGKPGGAQILSTLSW